MSKPVKPVDRNDSRKQHRFAFPHLCCMLGNQKEGLRMAKQRWKRNRSKYLRRKGREDMKEAFYDT